MFTEGTVTSWKRMWGIHNFMQACSYNLSPGLLLYRAHEEAHRVLPQEYSTLRYFLVPGKQGSLKVWLLTATTHFCLLQQDLDTKCTASWFRHSVGNSKEKCSHQLQQLNHWCNILQICWVTLLKKQLKTHLFRQAFRQHVVVSFNLHLSLL